MSIEQANPNLWRQKQYGEIDRQNREAMFAPFTLAEKLKKMQQFNKYYPEDMESTFRGRDANTDYIKTQNQWFGPTAQSHIDQIYQGIIPTAQANVAKAGAETEGLQHTNRLNTRISELLKANENLNNFGSSGDTSTTQPSVQPSVQPSNSYAPTNSFTPSSFTPRNNFTPSNNSMPKIDASQFTGGLQMSVPQYEKLYEHYSMQANNPEYQKALKVMPSPPVYKQMLSGEISSNPADAEGYRNFVQQHQERQQPNQGQSSNADGYDNSQMYPSIEEARKQQNEFLQSNGNETTLSQLESLGLNKPLRQGMSVAPGQGRGFEPSSQSINMLQNGINPQAQQQEQQQQFQPTKMSAQLPENLNPQAQIERNNREIAGLRGLANKGKGAAQLTPEEKIAYKVQEVRAVDQAKNLEATSKKYTTGEAAASAALPRLQNVENALKKLPSTLANSWSPELLKRLQNNPDYQVAMKAVNDLVVAGIRPAFQGTGPVRVIEIQKLAAGLPSAEMTPKALAQVIEQVRTHKQTEIEEGKMAGKLKRIPGIDGEDIDKVIAMASRVLPTVSSKGSHQERLKDWNKFITPEAIQAARNGIDYIPSGIDIKNLSNEAIAQLLSEGRI